ncbi:putative membrane protein [Catalinimonas alkaloidigena]|uniref:TPM domain-containing protein n=1 Tax=Catalinimonas alkaloidigena TaxID=1075417 RepID=UPI002405E090|nr:TPM domain-containing protein [Catalinimonas alkaloidigena]MDF9798206.1 putative membrane protein [Catalinimonas alkaloidigena]
MSQSLITKEEALQIKNAVTKAEELSGGDIVPVISRQSSWYEYTLWRAGALFSLLTAIVLTIIYLSSDTLLWFPPYLWLLICTTGGIAGATLTESFSFIKRFFISKESLKQQAESRAKQLFVEQSISHTEQRTGILLYISFFEKHAIILPDIGISEIVDQNVWDEILLKLVNDMKNGAYASAICHAIVSCGKVLEESGIQKVIEDDNELPDKVHIDE